MRIVKVMGLISKSQQGQIAVIMLLVMVILLTIGLSLAARTTQDVFLSQQQAESARVFSAAESGVEQALSLDFESLDFQNPDLPPVEVQNATVEYSITPSTDLETRLAEGQTAYINLKGAGSDTVQVEWATESETGCNAASLLISIYFEDSGVTHVRHYPISPCDRGDSFDTGDVAGATSPGYSYRVPMSVNSSQDLFMRIKAVYHPTVLKVNGSSLPYQNFTVRSEASNDLGDEQRIVEVTRSLLQAPDYMDYSVYAKEQVVKTF